MSDETLLQYANTLAAQGDIEGADAALSARVRIAPFSAEAVHRLADLRFNRFAFESALAVLESHKNHPTCAHRLREYYIGERFNAEAAELIHSTPKTGSTDDLIDQAVILQISGDARSAAMLCRKVLTVQPGNAYAFNHLGRALFNTGSGAEALACFESAIKLNPAYFQAWHNLGHVRRAQGDFKNAESAYRKAIEIAPYYQSALLNLALLLMSRGDNANAIEILQKLLKINPDHAEALLNLGICHQIGRDYAEAESAFLHASRVTPGDSRIWRHLGGLYRELQDSGKSIECFRRALAIDPTAVDIRAELVSTLELVNELDQADSLIAEGLALKPDDANLLFESAKIQRRRDNESVAYVMLKSLAVTDLHPRLRQSYCYELATVADRLGYYDAAFSEFSKGNEMALSSIRARNTSKQALAQQMDAVERWLRAGAACPADGEGEDLGDDLCFLIGFPRSGTTLLDVMLDGHENVLAIEEKPTIERIAFKLDQMPGHYPFGMQNIAASARAELRSAYREQIAQHRTSSHRLVIDKMPIRTIHAAFVHRLFPNARFLFSERHPCDVVLSNFMQQYAINEAMIHFTKLDSTVALYDRIMQLWLLTRQTMPSMRVHNVRYETLLENTEQTLRGTCEFLGLPWQSGIENHQNTLAQRSQINTNSYHQVAQPVYQRSKYRWLNYRTPLQPYMNTLQQHIDRMGY